MPKILTKIPKFRRCVLQNFPFIEEDFDALTDYQLLCKVVEYLNKVIKSQNEVIDIAEALTAAFNELQSFVQNYFANLDVQEEINNKLDQMAEDGILQEIITTYIQANVAWTFDTVADMKLATNLVNGSYARTLGFHSINDGGGALYKITDTGTADEMYTIAINNNLYANVIIQDYITPEILGAYGDGEHDDTIAVQKCLNNINFKHSVLSKDYKITSALSIPSYKIVDGGGSIHSTVSCFELDGIAHVTMRDLFLYPQLHAIHITSDSSWCNYNVFENIFANGSKDVNTKGLFLEVTDHYINEQTYINCVFWNFGYGIYALNDSESIEMGAHIFNQCSTELSKTAGQYIKKGNNFRFMNCRHAESISCIWITEGHCESLLIEGGVVIANTINNMRFSEDTTGQIIAGLRYAGVYGYTPVRNAVIVGGKVVPTPETLDTSRTNVTADRTVAYGQQLYLYYNFNTPVDCTLTLPTECYGGNGKINEFYVRTSKENNTSTVVIGGVTKVLPAGTHVYRFTLNTTGGGTNWFVEEITNAV